LLCTCLFFTRLLFNDPLFAGLLSDYLGPRTERSEGAATDKCRSGHAVLTAHRGVEPQGAGRSHGLGQELQAHALLPLRLADGAGDVHVAADRQFTSQVTLLPGDALDAFDQQLQGCAVAANGPGALEAAGQGEEWGRMPLAERFEV